MSYCILFFFQAEDGIRDVAVTGVQTCALPISQRVRPAPTEPKQTDAWRGSVRKRGRQLRRRAVALRDARRDHQDEVLATGYGLGDREVGKPERIALRLHGACIGGGGGAGTEPLRLADVAEPLVEGFRQRRVTLDWLVADGGDG